MRETEIQRNNNFPEILRGMQWLSVSWLDRQKTYNRESGFSFYWASHFSLMLVIKVMFLSIELY